MYSKLNNLYWHIRYTQNKSVKRRYYRYVAAEKNALFCQALIGNICGFIAVHLVTVIMSTLKEDCKFI